jgi:hypothetical protein
MNEFKLISADGHINEPPAAWERVQKEYRERAPKVVKDRGIQRHLGNYRWVAAESVFQLFHRSCSEQA